MKPFVILALWAFLGWDVGAWAQAYMGIPAIAGALVGAACGALLAFEARKRLVAKTAPAADAGSPVLAFEPRTEFEQAA